MPMDRNSDLVLKLVAAFKSIKRDNGIPDWAWKYSPPVPFVGKNYKKGEGLLVYASAENLSWTKTGKPEHFSEDEKAYTRRWDFYEDYLHHCNRYKGMFDEEGTHVGIGPFDSGGLLVAARIVSEHFGLPMSDEPDKFLEMLAVTNWCKFTILCMAFKNHDYAGDVEKLKSSLPYVLEELSMLRPAVVLMPKETFKALRDYEETSALAEEWRTQYRLLALRQFVPVVINCHLKSYEKCAAKLSKNASKALVNWIHKIKGLNHHNVWRYLAHVKSVLENGGTCEDR